MATDPVETNVQPAAVRNASTAKRVSLWLQKGSEDRYIELGNIISPKLAMDIQELEHYSNRRGARSRDRIEIGQIKGSMKFSVDECNKRNLLHVFGGSDEAAASTVAVEEGNIFENPGVGQDIDVLMTGVANVIVEDTAEEGTPVTYDEDVMDTDTTDNAAGGTWANTTDPLTVVAATYPNMPTTPGALIKVEDELMAVVSASTNIVLARAQLGTVAASHANGTDIFKESGADDYVLGDGKLRIVVGSALADPDDVPEVHIQFTKTVETEKFQMFDGTPITGKAKLQVLTPKGLRAVITLPRVTIKNDGDVDLGTGETWIAFPMQMEILADSTGSLGDFHLINQDQVL